MIDLRSDTVTKPSPAMLEAMMKAAVGDDVFGEDPTVRKLESMLAGMFGKEAAVFCASGTMSNQIAIKAHTNPGDEIICEQLSHVYIYEGGGIAFNSLCQVKALPGNRGRISVEQVKEAINPADIHKAKTSLVCLENTSNRGGGSCYDFNEIQQIKEVCLNNNLKLHLDGARLFNALVSKQETPKQYGAIFDSISICLSKGLGAPVGSVLLGDAGYIAKARRIRKIFGGGMRQAGYLASAGIFALENNIARLAEDHLHAKKIEAALLEKNFTGKIMPVETNLLIFEVKNSYTTQTFASHLKNEGILCMPISETQVRMVTHLDFTEDMLKKLITVIEKM